MGKHKVDKDLKKITKFQSGLGNSKGVQLGSFAFAVLFLVAVFAYAMMQQNANEMGLFVVAAAVIGGYMAMNIGANDVANNIGPAVGSKALTMFGALIIAAIFEAAGALLAGGDVVSTIKNGIIDPAQIGSSTIFIWAMISALLAAALWLNLATWVGAPVSTTHSIVGGVMGAGIAAAGMASVSWGVMGKIAASWVISPVLGGLIAAAFLFTIKKTVLYKEDKITAAKRWVPIMVGIMAGAFGMYLAMKGLKKIWKVDTLGLWSIGLGSLVLAWLISKPIVAKAANKMENRKKSVTKLFTIPLIFSAALLSFAHGANDVANAVGPLAAVVSSVQDGGIEGKVAIPIWVMMIGALGISIGLMLYGPKLIRTVGEQITKLNQIRAFCVALAAAITVIIASWQGLPVSSTHIAVGGVFGVGFLREYLKNKSSRERVIAAAIDDTGPAVKQISAKKSEKRKLVRRSHLLNIVLAWVLTVPLAALLAAVIFYIIEGMSAAV